MKGIKNNTFQKNLIKEKGITLIALVITIIIIIILSSISISFVVGNKGIITTANYTKKITTTQVEKDDINMAYNALMIDKYAYKTNSITVDNFKRELSSTGRDMNDFDIMLDSKNNANIYFKNTKNEYLIGYKGKVESIADSQRNFVYKYYNEEEQKRYMVFVTTTQTLNTDYVKFIITVDGKTFEKNIGTVYEKLLISSVSNKTLYATKLESNFITGYVIGGIPDDFSEIKVQTVFKTYLSNEEIYSSQITTINNIEDVMEWKDAVEI